MTGGTYEWAGVAFLAVGHHDAGMIRAPGLYGFVKRGPGSERVLLYVDHADCIALAAHPGHLLWAEALGFGMNEIHLCLNARERLDRLQLRHHIVKRTAPILNLIGQEAPAVEPRVQRCSG